MNREWAFPAPDISSGRTNEEAGRERYGTQAESSLDPADWASARALAHQALDEALDLIQSVRERPVWTPVPTAIKKELAEPLPVKGQGIEETYRQFQERVLPYATGNIHPRFFG